MRSSGEGAPSRRAPRAGRALAVGRAGAVRPVSFAAVVRLLPVSVWGASGSPEAEGKRFSTVQTQIPEIQIQYVVVEVKVMLCQRLPYRYSV